MKKILKFLMFTLFFVPVHIATADTSTIEDRRELQSLLMERKEKFDAYESSLGKRSGFFGNKTKSDLKSSHDALSEIVATDNRIIRTLNRVVDFRNYEKATMNYDLRERDVLLEGLRFSVDTLSRRADALAAENRVLEKSVNMRTLFIYLLGAAALLLYFLPGRRLK